MPHKIVVIHDIGWSVERVHNAIFRYLNDKYEIRSHNSKAFHMEHFMRDFQWADICLTTFNHSLDMWNIFSNPDDQKKIMIVCHGHKELDMKFVSAYMTYSLTSDILSSHFPDEAFITPNGVDDKELLSKEPSGMVENLGWCGATNIDVKRFNNCLQIANKTKLPISIATSLTFENLKKWYNTIDILLVTSGPENYVETGPLPAFEAILSGAVVVGTNVGNFSKIPCPKYNTIDEAVTMINELKNNPIMMKTLWKTQYDEVMKNWTYKTLCHKWNDVFNHVLKKSSSKGSLNEQILNTFKLNTIISLGLIYDKTKEPWHQYHEKINIIKNGFNSNNIYSFSLNIKYDLLMGQFLDFFRENEYKIIYTNKILHGANYCKNDGDGEREFLAIPKSLYSGFNKEQFIIDNCYSKNAIIEL